LPNVQHRNSATGIILGLRQTQEQKGVIYDIMLTPDPKNTEQDLKNLNPQANAKKGLFELLTSKYREFNYAEWVAEYKNALEKFLTTDVEILGLYVYAQNPEQKTNALRGFSQL
jgi:hypothetical protein